MKIPHKKRDSQSALGLQDNGVSIILGRVQLYDFGSLPGPCYINITIQTEPVFVGFAHSFVRRWT